MEEVVVSSGDQTSKKHKQHFELVPGTGVGVRRNGLFLGEKEKHINEIPRKHQEYPGTLSQDIPGQSHETVV